jgi:hypothetical protein
MRRSIQKQRLVSASVALLAWAAACREETTVPSVTTTEVGPALPADHPPVPGEPVSRRTNRVSIAQLKATFPVVFGNDAQGRPITWTVSVGASRVNGFDAFAGPLGVPDYLLNTEEALEPSPLYLKFVNDAALDACDKALLADWGRIERSARTLLRHVELGATEAGVVENLKYLKLRFHGVKATEADVQPLKALFSTVVRSAAARAVPSDDLAREGWRAVCVALATAPEFHLY